MSSILVSEDMTLCQFIFPLEAAYCCVSALGEIGKVYFRDLNPNAKVNGRAFYNEITRCDEMEKKMQFLFKELKRFGIKPEKDRIPQMAPMALEINEIEHAVEKLERDMKQVCETVDMLVKNINDLTELKYLMENTSLLVDGNTNFNSFDERDGDPVNSGGLESRLALGRVTGVVDTDRVLGFQRLVWRVSRGTALMRYQDIDFDIENPETGEKIRKSAFIILFQGEQLRAKIKKICDGYNASVYQVPDKADERTEMLEGINRRLDDLMTVYRETKDHNAILLESIAKEIRHWMIKIRKTKSIYHTMDMLDIDTKQTLLIGEGWVPSVFLDDVQESLIAGQLASGSLVPVIMNKMDHGKLIPPTYFRTNKFTKIYQTIVNAYGMPTYKELNPALFSLMTFPFLFAVMFGDAGDAIILILFSGFLLVFEKQLLLRNNTDVFGMIFKGRYLIFCMGVFSVYTGIMYNDMFSLSFNIFGTAWYPSPTRYSLYGPSGELNGDITNTPTFTLNPEAGTDYSGYPYPFGMDPVWALAENSITWLNSFKMKLSVLLGVTHMFFGLCVGLGNHIRRRNYLSIFCEFIPMTLFLTCIFGYMNILIFYKWFAYNGGTGTFGAACAPTILVDMIDMFLFQYPNATSPNTPCYSTTFYPDQKTVQTILVLIAVVCVPWILFPKPFVLRYLHNKQVKKDMEEYAKLVEETSASISKKPVITVNIVDETHAVSDGNHIDEKMATAESGAFENKGADISVDEIVAVESKFSDIEMQEAKPTVTISVQEQSLHKDTRTRAEKERPDEPEDEEFQFSEVFVHQAIHTIEYCLGCISHTASYLRLWALSLAHAELALVLWDLVFRWGFTSVDGYFGVLLNFILFPVWATFTVAILLCMEGMSSFLHTLRLHWVEFQSKFYGGTGHRFLPFNFKKIIDAMWEEIREM